MKTWIFTSCIILLLGCSSHLETSPYDVEVNSFEKLSLNVGKEVILDGLLSVRHEAGGLYFKKADLKLANSQCVGLSPAMSAQHGSRIRVAGRLVASECALERICITACDKYTLILR
jgi:hypothetical protein